MLYKNYKILQKNFKKDIRIRCIIYNMGAIPLIHMLL